MSGADAVPAAARLSNSGVCHVRGSAGYDLTRQALEFDSLQACLDAGGRLPASAMPPSKDASTFASQVSESFAETSSPPGWVGPLLLGLAVAVLVYVAGRRSRRRH